MLLLTDRMWAIGGEGAVREGLETARWIDVQEIDTPPILWPVELVPQQWRLGLRALSDQESSHQQ